MALYGAAAATFARDKRARRLIAARYSVRIARMAALAGVLRARGAHLLPRLTRCHTFLVTFPHLRRRCLNGAYS
jgi:hypothetical protein